MLSGRTLFLLFWLTVLVIVPSCDSFYKEEFDKVPLARVGNAYLYHDDLANFISPEMSAKDSMQFVSNYINKWAEKRILLEKSKINLPETKMREFDKLVAEYRTDLYTNAYKEALIQQNDDRNISEIEILEFYKKEKENFRLTEKLVKLRFIEMPLSFSGKNDIAERMNRFSNSDRTYLDSVAVHFKKAHFNDSIWVNTSRVISEIGPLNFQNVENYMAEDKFFRLQDSVGVYMGKITQVLNVNDIAPYTYIIPDIKQVIMNRRRSEYTKKLGTEIIQEAIKKKEFEIYDEG